MSLIHNLIVGHFDLSAGRKIVCTRPLDMDRARQVLLAAGATEGEGGQLEVGGTPVQVQDGYITLHWMSGFQNTAAEQVGLAVARELGAILAEERVLGLWGPMGKIFYPPELANAHFSP